MKQQSERETLGQLLARVRRRIFLRSAAAALVSGGVVTLPVAALLIAVNHRWRIGSSDLLLAGSVLVGLAVFAIARGAKGLGARARSALFLDEQARLKDRISSAYEFLEQGDLDPARETQVQDALAHARSLDFKTVFRFEWPRFSVLLPVGALAFLLSFLVPPILAPTSALAASDPVKQAQLKQLEELRQDLQTKKEPDKELQEVLKKLQDIKRQFEKGEMSERDVMLELARLDEDLRQKSAQMGVENLEAELNAIVPHLMSSATTMEAATALKEGKLDQAAEELQKLADKVKQDKLTKEQKRELAMNLGVCASKLGGKEKGSFGGALAKASESLEKSDSKAFESACKSMSDQLSLVKKSRAMKSACLKIGNCKQCLAQCDSKEMGFKIGLKQQGKGRGGLKAGTAASNDPFGDPNRLADSFRKALHVSGQAGAGPVESETETTEGQVSQSQVDLREVHASYAAAAEEAIEKEDVPLSQRYHVKRYFQAIRPQE